MKRRLLAFVLVIAMVVSMLPVGVFAAGEQSDATEVATREELQTALDAGKSVKLTANIEFSGIYNKGEIIKVPSLRTADAVNVTLDLNGYALRQTTTESGGTSAAAICIRPGSTLTVKDSSEAQSGTIEACNCAFQNEGTLIMESGKVIIGKSASGADLSAELGFAYGVWMYMVDENAPAPSFTMTGGSIEMYDRTDIAYPDKYISAVACGNGGDLSMYAGVEVKVTSGSIEGNIVVDENATVIAPEGTTVLRYDQNGELPLYVSLGDSMTNGYGLTGYDANSGVEDYGYGSYANQFAEHYGFNHAQLAMSAMRAEDLHWLIEVDYETAKDVISGLEASGWNEEQWYTISDIGDYWTWKELVHDYRFDVAAYCIEGKDETDGGKFNDIANDGYKIAYDTYDDAQALEKVAKYYQESVANADVISLGMGNGNFGVFMFGRITDSIGFGGEPADAMIYDIDNIYRDCNPELTAALQKLQGAAAAILKDYGFTAYDGEGEVTMNEALYNTLMYAVLSYAVNYAGSVEAILELNPDAEIIQVALMNTIKSNTPSANGEATLGEVMDMLFGPLNIYLAALPTYMQAIGHGAYDEANFYWAEAPYVECIVDTYDDGPLNDTVRDRFVESIVGEYDEEDAEWSGMVWNMAGPMFNNMVKDYGLALCEISLADVEAYETFATEWANYAADTTGEVDEPTTTLTDCQILSCAVYLAFEKALIEGGNAPLEISALIGIGGGVDFSGVAGALTGEGGLDMEAISGRVQPHVMTAAATGALAYKNTLDDPNKATFEGIATAAISLAGEALAPVVAHYAMTNNVTDLSTLNMNVVTGWVMTTNSSTVSAYTARYLGAAITDPLADALVGDDSLSGLLALFARCVIGNGIGSHPSQAGHDALYAELVDTYGEYTAEDETDANLAEIKHAPVAWDIYMYLRTNNYIDETQALDIALVAADAYLNDQTLDDAESLKVIKYVYNSIFQIGSTEMADEDRLAIIGGVYEILKDYGYFTGYEKYLKVLENIIAALDGKVSDEKAFELVNFIYTTVMVETGDTMSEDVRRIIGHIWFVTLKTSASAGSSSRGIGFSGSSSGASDDELTVEEKLEIIETVFAELKADEELKESYPQVEAIIDLYDELTAPDAVGDQIVPDEAMIEMFDKVIAVVGEVDESTGELVYDLTDSAKITEAAAEITETLFTHPSIKDENKPTILASVSNTLEEIGMDDAIGGEDSGYDLAVVVALRDALEAAGYLTDKQQGEIIEAVAAVLPELMAGEQPSTEKMAEVADEVYGIVFNREDLSFADKIAIVGIVYDVLNEYGYVDGAYAMAMQQPEVQTAISEAVGYIDIALDALLAADNFVHLAEVPSELETTRDLLQKEISNTMQTLYEIRGILASAGVYDEDYAKLMAMEENLKDHYENIMALAAELEIVITPYVEDLNDAVVYYSALVEEIAEETYAWFANGVEEFADEYAAWVEEMGALADEVDPALGDAVRKFLTETPADTLAILYNYGDIAATKLIVDAAAAAGDVYTIAAALAQLLYEDGEEIYNAVIASDAYNDIKAQIEDIIAEIDTLAEEAAKAPITTALGYQEKIDALKVELSGLYTLLYNTILDAADEVDPAIRPMVNKLMSALGEALGIAGDAANAYGSFIVGHVGAMAGELLSALLENWNEFYGEAAPIIRELIWTTLTEINNFLMDVYAEVEAEVIKQLGLLEAELENLKAQLKNAAGELYEEIMAQIEIIEAQIEALKALIEEGIEALPKIVAALEELKGELEDLIEDLKAAALDEAAKTLEGIKDALEDLKAALPGAIAEALEELKEIMGELGQYLIDEIYEAVKKYAPEIADAIYDYLYNNPAEVIAFFTEYGDEILALAKEYGDEALMVIGGILYFYGEDIAAYIVENADELMADMLAWFETHGENAWALICVYLEELGVFDAIDDAYNKAIAAATALMEALKEHGDELYAELQKIAADILQQIEDLKAELEGLYEDLKNAAEDEKAAILEKIAEIQNKLNALYAELYEKLLEAAAKIDAELPGLIKDAYEAFVEAIVDYVREVAPEVADWLYDYLYNNAAEVIGFFREYGDEAIKFLKDHLEETIAILGYLVLSFGDEVLEYVMDNAEKIMADLVAWLKTHGENAWALICVYLKELGLCDCIEDILGEASDKLEGILAKLGEELAEAIEGIVKNIEAKIAELEEMIEDLKAQLEDLKAELEAKLEELENASEELKAEIEAVIAEIEKAIEAIEKAIAELEAKIAELRQIAEDIIAAVEDVIAAIEKLGEDFEAGVEALQAALEKLADAIEALEDFIAELNATIDGIQEFIADVIATLSKISEDVSDAAAKIIAETIAVFEAVEEAVREIKETIEGAAAALEQAIADLKAAIFKAQYAVLSKCSYGEEMVYVSLGGATAAAGTYADAVGEYVEADEIIKLGQAMLYADQYDYVIANAADIAKADFITYQMDANEIVDALVDVIIAVNVGGNYTAPNWGEYVDLEEVGKTAAEVEAEVKATKAELVEYLDEETIAWIASVEAEILAELEALMDEETRESLKPYVEHLAYKLVAYAIETAEAIEAVTTINETAPVVLVGMYNSLDGVVVKMNGQEIDLGEFFAYVVDAVDVYNFIYAVVSGNVTVVDASEASVDAAVIDVDAFMALYAYVDEFTADIIALTESLSGLGSYEEIQAVLAQIEALQAKLDAVIEQIKGAYLMIGDIIAATANEEGHAYIAEKIAEAIIIVDHTATDAVKENVVAATCTVDGSYDSVIYCAVCGEELSRETVIVPAGHTPAANAVVENEVAADCTTPGSYDSVVYCSVCGEELSRTTVIIPATGHEDNDGDGNCDSCGEDLDGEEPGPGTVVPPVTPPAEEEDWECPGDENCAAKVFKDIDIDAWYHEAICYAYNHELMIGMNNGLFEPKTTTSRAMIVMTLYRLEGSPEVDGENVYTDVKNDVWYTDAIIWATENGIVNGYGGGKFGPSDDVTREQIATMLYRYADYLGMDTDASADLSSYTDVDEIHAWALDAMKWANAVELMEGRTETTLNPRENTMRSELATLLMRWCEEIVK